MVADWRPLLSVVAGQWGQAHGGAAILILAIALPLALAIAFMLSPRGDDLAMVAIAAVMALAALVAVRNTPFAIIAASAPLAHHATGAVRRFQGRARASTEASPIAHPVRPSVQAIIGALALLLASESGLFSGRIPGAIGYPVGAVDFMRAHRLHGNVLNYFDWGQYLIWHVSPECRVFIDGRYDLAYPVRVIRNYMDFYAARADARRVLMAYPHDYVLIPPPAPALATVLAQSHWKLVYGDNVCALFAREGTAASTIPLSVGVPRPSFFP